MNGDITGREFNARSQFLRGTLWGIGFARYEDRVYDLLWPHGE